MFLGQKNEVKRSSNVLYFTGEIMLIRGMLNSICTISKTIKKNYFPTDRVYSKIQTRVTANQHIFKRGLSVF